MRPRALPAALLLDVLPAPAQVFAMLVCPALAALSGLVSIRHGAQAGWRTLAAGTLLAVLTVLAPLRSS